MKSTYRLVKHAAHYCDATKPNGGGHDLDEWTIVAPNLPSVAKAGLPSGAKFHHGYMTGTGEEDAVQHWVFTRLAPFSPDRCDRCPENRK